MRQLKRTCYVLTDKDKVLIVVGTEKRKIVTVFENSKLPIARFKSKKFADLCLKKKEDIEVSPSASQYMRTFYKRMPHKAKDVLIPTQCTTTDEF